MPSPLLRLSFLSPLFGLVVLSLGSLASAQGENGYLRGKGGWLVGFSYQEAEFEETLGQGQGSVLDVNRESLSLYLDFGLRDDLDLIIQPLYQKAEFTQFAFVPAEENLTDIQIYAKWRLWKREVGPGELHFLAAPGLQTELKNYETDGFLSLGAGQTDWRARGIAHYQARTGRWFAAVEAGYDFRTGSPPDNLVIRSQIGINLGPVVLQPYFDVFDARGGSEEAGDVIGSPQAGGLDYDVWGIKAFVPIGKNAGIYGGYFELDDNRPSGVVPGIGFGLVVSG